MVKLVGCPKLHLAVAGGQKPGKSTFTLLKLQKKTYQGGNLECEGYTADFHLGRGKDSSWVRLEIWRNTVNNNLRKLSEIEVPKDMGRSKIVELGREFASLGIRVVFEPVFSSSHRGTIFVDREKALPVLAVAFNKPQLPYKACMIELEIENPVTSKKTIVELKDARGMGRTPEAVRILKEIDVLGLSADLVQDFGGAELLVINRVVNVEYE